MHNEFREAGFRIFGLYGIDQEGRCMCGYPDCSAPGKHPIASGWQHTPDWSDEQWETAHDMGQFDTGYGVLVSHGLLVIDVDARNGGVDSYTKLVAAIPEIAAAGLIVETGSGGGSKHLYFSLHEPIPLMQHLPAYTGIDFKSSGYVVGPGSIHASGTKYKVLTGEVYDIEPAPPALIDLLKKPDRHRCSINSTGEHIDISENDITEMLKYINPDCDHEIWVRCGMAIHEATGGSGFQLWDDWSALGEKYPGHEKIDRRWQSFGKSSNPVTIGTLLHYAEEGGWKPPVEFISDVYFEDVETTADPLDVSGIDLLRPPGFAGELCDWINSRSIYPRESLAVAAALMTISNVAGMRYSDPLDGSSFNLFCFGVADSATGKESILEAHNELIRAAGLSPALVGGIKSEQEIYRNLIRHQAAFYSIDELGEQLAKITNARARGSATYLEGVIGALMSLYSKANSFAPVTGDLKEEIRQQLLAERNRLQKAIDDNEDKNGAFTTRLERIDSQLATVDMGIDSPFLSIFGLTTPERFNTLMDFDMAANGFMGRALIFREHNGNPRIKPRDKRSRTPVPDHIANTLAALYAPGYYDMTDDKHRRIERHGDKYPVQTTKDAANALDAVIESFWQTAEDHRDATGLHPIPRRGYELVAKISGTLAIPGGLRTIEHVRWAYALVKRDVDAKMLLAHGNSAKDKGDALAATIMACVTSEHGETLRGISRTCRKYRKEDVKTCIDKLIENGALTSRESTGRGRPTTRYYAV